MKRIIFISFVIMVLSANVLCAKTYDISQISQAKLVMEYSKDTTVDQMDTVTFGSFPQSDASVSTKEPIEWLVLEKEGDKALLLSKYILVKHKYNDEYCDITWENCTCRKLLNSDFINQIFSKNEQSSILTTDVINNDNVEYGTKGGNNTKDKIFLLSIDEFKKYFNEDWQSVANYKNDSGGSMWWLRSTGYPQAFAACVLSDGYLGTDGLSVIESFGGVRPALWVSNLKSSISQSSNSYGDGGQTISSSISGTIAGLPSRESKLKNDNRFYLDDNVQKNSWVYYVKEYYHVDGSGNIEKSKWIEQRYVGSDGKMYRGRQTPDGQWVGNDGLVVNVTQDLQKSILVEAAEPDSWYRTQNGLWYYFENDRTTTKRGWFNDKRDNQWYYLEPITGIMQVGWVNIDGKDYYFNESHDNEPNWYEIEDGFYESYGKKVKSYGSMFKNEKTPDGHWVNNDGVYIQNSNAIQEKENIKTPDNSKITSKYNDVLKAVPIIIIVTLLIGIAVYVNKKF